MVILQYKNIKVISTKLNAIHTYPIKCGLMDACLGLMDLCNASNLSSHLISLIKVGKVSEHIQQRSLVQ